MQTKRSILKIILFQPQIPQNTGNIVRTCAVTGCDLILVRPLGFKITDRWLKRAGLDYWEGVSVKVVDEIDTLLESSNFYFFSSKAKNLYTDAPYSWNDALVFGSETTGLPSYFFEKWPEKALTLPMREGPRCLNLATSAGIAIYEAWRQCAFSGAKKSKKVETE